MGGGLPSVAQVRRRVEAMERLLSPPPPPPPGRTVVERRGGVVRLWWCPPGTSPGQRRAVLCTAMTEAMWDALL